MTTHFITKCSCGAVINQCRCPAQDKAVQILERGCVNCHNSTASVKRKGDEWVIHDGEGQFVILSHQDWTMISSIIHEHYHGED